jgi:hypothetical protein
MQQRHPLAHCNVWRYFEKCGTLITADGTRDSYITPEGMMLKDKEDPSIEYFGVHRT